MESVNKVSCVVILTFLCILPLASAQRKDLTLEMKQQPVNEPLTLLWGIADTTGYVGRLFSYTLPDDAFQGNIVHIDVSI